MQIFFWLAFLVAIGVAIFAVQNSTAPPVEMKFLSWNFGTSLLYTILISIGSGMLVILLLWIPRAIKSSLQAKSLRKEIEILKKEMKHHMETTAPKEE
jgi:uncharacterized integral membrane protein